MRRLSTVRAGYLYIIGGSLLLSGVLLLTLQGAASFIYSRHTADSSFVLITLLRWMINHIGRLPLAVAIFTVAAAVFFLLRSQPLSDDFKAVVRASEELVLTGCINELKISAGGELGRLAANLQEMNRRNRNLLKNNNAGHESAPSIQGVDFCREDSMALILRMKTLLRLLDELEAAEGALLQAEAVKREAAGLERFLESLIGRS